jgi:hypothetical protein
VYQHNVQTNAVLTVAVARLEDAEGNSLFDDVNFSEYACWQAATTEREVCGKLIAHLSC